MKYFSDVFEERHDKLRKLFKNDANDNIYYLPSEGYDCDEDYEEAIKNELELIEHYMSGIKEVNVIWVPPHARWNYLKETAALTNNEGYI